MKKILLYGAIIGSLLGAQIVYFNFVYFRLSLFRICLLCLLLITLVALMNGTKVVLHKENKFSIAFMVIWFMYAIVSVLWVKDYFLWIKSCWFIGCGTILCVIFCVYIKKIADFKNIFFLLSIMVMFHQIIGWYEMLTRNYVFSISERLLARTQSFLHFPVFSPPVSVFVNQNDYALVVLFGIFVSHVCFGLCRNKLIKICYFLLMVSGAILLYFTNSRANMVGLIMGICCYTFIKLGQKKHGKIILLTLVVFFLFVISPYMENIMQKLMVFDFSGNTLNSESIRVNLILNGFYFLVQTIGFGVGAGNIEYWMATRLIYPVGATGEYANIHNWWVEILTAYGVFIFVLYIVFFVCMFVSFYKKYTSVKSKSVKTISLGFMCMMASFVLGSISSSSNIGTEWLWVFWAVAIAFQGYKEHAISKIAILSPSCADREGISEKGA